MFVFIDLPFCFVLTAYNLYFTALQINSGGKKAFSAGNGCRLFFNGPELQQQTL
jgi:hypothetical protein